MIHKEPVQQKPIRLILVRHGNTFESGETPVQVGSRSNLPLTAKGKEQAHQFAQKLISEKTTPSAIYAGTLKRQIQSAEIIGKDLNLEKIITIDEPALTEIDYGLWEGLTAEEIEDRWSSEYSDWNEQAIWPENIFGRSMQWHQDEIGQWLQQLRSTYQPEDTVIGITSNGIIRLFYSYDRKEWLKLQQERKIDHLKVKTGHYCELLLYQDSLKVKAWNVDSGQKPQT